MACTLAPDDASTGRCEDLETATGMCLCGTDINMTDSNVFVVAKIYVGAGKRDYVPEDKRVPVGGEK